MHAAGDRPVALCVNAFEPLVDALAQALRCQRALLVTAESCTGGLVAATCTSLAGSSDWFERGFVTYSNQAKIDCLGVDAALISEHGAVSEPVARAMAAGALERSLADVAVAVTGIAGPGGATPGKPVGTVWLAWARRNAPTYTQHLLFAGNRASVREQTVEQALRRLLELLAVSTDHGDNAAR